MANIVKFDVQDCELGDIYQLFVDDVLSAITSGNTYYFQPLPDIRFNIGCYTVITSVVPDVATPTATLVGDGYTDCTECFANTSLFTIIKSCDPSIVDEYALPLSAFTGPINVNDTYYISFTYKDSKQITGCYYIYKFGSNPGVDLGVVTSPPILQTTCDSCYAENSFVYEVINCLDGTTKYILLSSSSYVGHLITYEELFLGQQFCGVVRIVQDATPDAIFIADLGEYVDPAQCEECLSQVTSKRIITNCITNIDEVVWASTLLGPDDYSNLSTNDGCFSVGDLTESAVTISTFLDFNPQPSCVDCIECTSIQYNYSSCTNTGPVSTFTSSYTGSSSLTPGYNGPFTGTTDSLDGGGATFYIFVDGAGVYIDTYIGYSGYRYDVGDTITIDGSLFGGITGDDNVVITITNTLTSNSLISFQYVENPIGTTLYVPWLDDCVEITSYSNPIIGSSWPIFSFNSLTDCTSCLNYENYVWLGEDCLTQQQYIVTTPIGFGPGDIVKGKVGSKDIACITLTEVYNPSMGPYQVLNSLDTEPYQTCEECISSFRINILIAECDGSNQQYVSVSLNDYYMITYQGNYIINLYLYDKCYAVVSTCPVSGNYPEISIRSFYLNCIDCVIDNTRQPRVSGNEVTICLELCDQTIVSVTPPHPVWSDAYGTEVTQLDMITLGGPNGLNN